MISRGVGGDRSFDTVRHPRGVDELVEGRGRVNEQMRRAVGGVVWEAIIMKL